jgi:hypothetical protein
MEPRETFKLIYKILMILVTIGLAIGAAAAWWYATPGNGLLLIAGILAILTLLSGLSIKKLEWQDQQTRQFASIVDDMRSNVKLSFSHSDPEVHLVDNAAFNRAKAMAASGEPIDEICRMIDPGHDRHDPAHQEALRRVVTAMID